MWGEYLSAVKAPQTQKPEAMGPGVRRDDVETVSAVPHPLLVIRGAPSSGANPESRGVVRHHIEIPGSREDARPGMTGCSPSRSID
jgi:hypothetical protein